MFSLSSWCLPVPNSVFLVFFLISKLDQKSCVFSHACNHSASQRGKTWKSKEKSQARHQRRSLSNWVAKGACQLLAVSECLLLQVHPKKCGKWSHPEAIPTPSSSLSSSGLNKTRLLGNGTILQGSKKALDGLRDGLARDSMDGLHCFIYPLDMKLIGLFNILAIYSNWWNISSDYLKHPLLPAAFSPPALSAQLVFEPMPRMDSFNEERCAESRAWPAGKASHVEASVFGRVTCLACLVCHWVGEKNQPPNWVTQDATPVSQSPSVSFSPQSFQPRHDWWSTGRSPADFPLQTNHRMFRSKQTAQSSRPSLAFPHTAAIGLSQTRAFWAAGCVGHFI